MTGTSVSEEALTTSYQSNDDESVFRTPSLTMSLRGRKRKSTYAEETFDYSVATPKRRRAKGATTRPKTTATAAERKKQPAAAAGAAVGGGDAPAALRNADPSGMFGTLKTGKNIATLVDNWIEFYENEPDRAIVQLLQLFISSCGCTGLIDSNMIHTMEYKNIIPRLAEDYDEETGEYPLVMAGPAWKKFRSNFCDFIMLFTNKCKSGAIFDIAVMDNLIQLLTGMADSQLRAFRHTATFAAMKLSSAIVDVIVDLVQVRDKYAIQIETEKAKLKTGTNDRLHLLLNSSSELDGKIEELSSMLQYMFKSVFVHRYRDVVSDIRCICIAELGNWMRTYSAFFLEDSYLKYIGWSLFDKVADVRLKCVSALLTLYENENLIGRLELFTNKFKERLVSMVMDAEPEVAIKTCHLMTYIYRAFPNLLDVNDCVPIYEIVYCSNRLLAVAAGEFLNAKVFTTSSASQPLTGSATSAGDEDNASSMERSSTAAAAAASVDDIRQQLADLVTFYVEGEVHYHASYLVDALIDIAPMVKEWPIMIEMLLNDQCDKYDTEMIDIMCCAVRQAATGEVPPGRSVVKRGAPSIKETRGLTDERIRISEAFMPHLPKLLTMHIADHAKIANLTTIPLFFHLDVYLSGRLETQLNDLMTVLERIVEQHLDDEILRNVSRIFQFFATHFAVAKATEPARLRLIDNVALQLRRNMQRFIDEEEPLDEEDEAALLASYRKMTAFISAIEIKNWDNWDITVTLLNNAHRFQSADLTEKAIQLLFSILLWEVKNLIVENETNEEAFRKLRKRRDQFLQCTKVIITQAASGVENAYLCLSDSLIIFNMKLTDDAPQNENFKSLIVKLDADFCRCITTFVSDNVFVPENNESFKNLDQQAQIELTYKRRNLLGQYCKLILHGILRVFDAANVLQFYIKFHNDFGDILKTLLQKCREMDRVSTAKAVAQALITSYDKLKFYTNSFMDPDSDDIADIKELAKRFALSFGPDNIRNREAIATIHKDCITYALELDEARRQGRPVEKPTNICFLEVLIEFSAKLVRQDKTSVLKYLERHCPKSSLDEMQADKYWHPYLLYRGSLAQSKNA